MKAATLKGLVINTAHEAGSNDGPDYEFGWGLLNAEGAANLITNDSNFGNLICEYELSNGETEEYFYYSDGTTDIRVTICWTDMPGAPTVPALDPPTKMLVNDLDLRIYKDTTEYEPWILDKNNPSNSANTGDNDVDNVEQVFIDNPGSGFYKIRVSHKGNISSGQDDSMIISGLRTANLVVSISIDANGNGKNHFSPEEHIYGKTTGLPLTDGTYPLYVVATKAWTRDENQTIPARIDPPGTENDPETTIEVHDGNIQKSDGTPEDIWVNPPASETAQYGIVVDINNDGNYDPSIDLLDYENDVGYGFSLPVELSVFNAITGDDGMIILSRFRATRKMVIMK